MKNTHTSLELSNKLYEAGFKKYSKNHWGKWWDKFTQNWTKVPAEYDIRDKNSFWFNPEFSAYDILNDLCVKYWKELFGEEWKVWQTFWIAYNLTVKKVQIQEWKLPILTLEEDNWKVHRMGRPDTYAQKIASDVMFLTTQGKKQEAEDYLWENCLLNKAK